MTEMDKGGGNLPQGALQGNGGPAHQAVWGRPYSGAKPEMQRSASARAAVGQHQQQAAADRLAPGGLRPMSGIGGGGAAAQEGLFFERTWSSGGTGAAALDQRSLSVPIMAAAAAAASNGMFAAAGDAALPGQRNGLAGPGGAARSPSPMSWGQPGLPAAPGIGLARSRSEVLVPNQKVGVPTAVASLSMLDLGATGGGASGAKASHALPSPRQPQSPSSGRGKAGGGISKSGSQVSMHSLYKTELCRSWEETGSCRYGSKCQFAHGKAELRPIARHPKYKTEICRTFAQNGTCPYGTRCRFIHYISSKDIPKGKQGGRRLGGGNGIQTNVCPKVAVETPTAAAAAATKKKKKKEEEDSKRQPQPATAAAAPGQSYDTWSELLDDSKGLSGVVKVKRTKSAFPRLEQLPQGGAPIGSGAPQKSRSQRLPIFENLSSKNLSGTFED